MPLLAILLSTEPMDQEKIALIRSTRQEGNFESATSASRQNLVLAYKASTS